MHAECEKAKKRKGKAAWEGVEGPSLKKRRVSGYFKQGAYVDAETFSALVKWVAALEELLEKKKQGEKAPSEPEIDTSGEKDTGASATPAAPSEPKKDTSGEKNTSGPRVELEDGDPPDGMNDEEMDELNSLVGVIGADLSGPHALEVVNDLGESRFTCGGAEGCPTFEVASEQDRKINADVSFVLAVDQSRGRGDLAVENPEYNGS